jgi:hypothetical protein
MTMTQPVYRCHDCKNKYKYEPERRKKYVESMACNFLADKPRHQYRPEHNNKGNPKISYNTCVGNFYFAYWASLINYYPDYEKGILPYSGSFFEQPAKFVEAMQLIHNLIRENENQKSKKDEMLRKNRRNGK